MRLSAPHPGSSPAATFSARQDCEVGGGAGCPALCDAACYVTLSVTLPVRPRRSCIATVLCRAFVRACCRPCRCRSGTDGLSHTQRDRPSNARRSLAAAPCSIAERAHHTAHIAGISNNESARRHGSLRRRAVVAAKGLLTSRSVMRRADYTTLVARTRRAPTISCRLSRRHRYGLLRELFS